MAAAQKLVHHGQDEQPVGARRDPDPLVGDRVVAGAHRVDADHLGAIGLELSDADLDRVAVVVLGDAEDHEQPGALPVRAAELPERAAQGIDPRRRHVDRAEPAMGGVVRRAVLLRPPRGQRLRLVAAGEESELARVVAPDRLEPIGGDGQRLVPLDLLELAGATRAGALQGFAQPRRGVMLHDPGRALGAEHAPVHRMVAVALDVADLHLAIGSGAQMHVDAAAAGAHVTGGLAHLVRDMRAGVELRFRSVCHHAPLSSVCPADHQLSNVEHRHQFSESDLTRNPGFGGPVSRQAKWRTPRKKGRRSHECDFCHSARQPIRRIMIR